MAAADTAAAVVTVEAAAVEEAAVVVVSLRSVFPLSFHQLMELTKAAGRRFHLY